MNQETIPKLTYYEFTRDGNTSRPARKYDIHSPDSLEHPKMGSFPRHVALVSEAMSGDRDADCSPPV